MSSACWVTRHGRDARFELANDVGEIIPIKKMLGLPYVAIAPQYAKKPSDVTPSAS